jgi:hypothetical protein
MSVYSVNAVMVGVDTSVEVTAGAYSNKAGAAAGLSKKSRNLVSTPLGLPGNAHATWTAVALVAVTAGAPTSSGTSSLVVAVTLVDTTQPAALQAARRKR